MVQREDLCVDADALAASDALVLDASWLYPPLNAAGIDVRARYAEAHIPGSVFLDLRALAPPRSWQAPDVAAIAPPTAASLRAALAGIGVGPSDALVVTDQDGGVSTAPFARLALLDAGFTDVRLLDGGTPAWVAAGRPLTAERPRVLDTPAVANATPSRRFVGTSATRAALADGSATVVDARFVPRNEGILPPRFAGIAIPTPVALRPGEVIEETANGMRWRESRPLRALAETRGLEVARPAIVTCHFGVGAAVVATALELAGIRDVRVDAASVLGWGTGPSDAQPVSG
jgi:thiosulfate/3-mercaptopyruvate sulfurtransferase